MSGLRERALSLAGFKSEKPARHVLKDGIFRFL